MTQNFKQFFSGSSSEEHLSELKEIFATLALKEEEKGHKRLAGGYSKSAFMLTLHGYWQKAVGPKVALHIRPLTIKRHTLILQADNPAYAQEFYYIKDLVLKCLNKFPELAEITGFKTIFGVT